MEDVRTGLSRAQRRTYVAAALGVLLLGAALRGYALGRFSLGNDEIHEVRWSRLPWPRMLAAAKREGVHPPLDYFVQTLLDRAGSPEWARRLPSVLAGIATIGLTVFLAGRWFGPIAGIAGGLLLALSPIHVRYSQEVRPYALGLMFLMASLAALEAFREKPRAVHGAGWFLGVLAAAYTLYFAGLIAALAGIAFIWTFRRTSTRPLWRALPLAVLGWAVLYLPWLPVILSAARGAPPGIAPERLDRAWAASRLQVFGTGDWKVEPVSIGSWAFWLLVAAGLLSARRSRFAAVAAVWLLGGAAIQVAILQLRPHYPAARYLLPSGMAAVVLAAAGVAFARARRTTWLWLAALIALAVILAFDVRTLRSYFSEGRPQWREVAAFLRERAKPGESLVAANSWVFRNLGYYWNEAGEPPPNVALEHSRTDVAGPAWLVLAVCPTSAAARAELDSLPLAAAYPQTNHCEIRYVPAGRTIRVAGLCPGDSNDFGESRLWRWKDKKIGGLAAARYPAVGWTYTLRVSRAYERTKGKAGSPSPGDRVMSLYALLCASALALAGAEPATREEVAGVPNFAVVSPVLSRGAQPTREGFRALRERGIRTIVALRWRHDDDVALAGLGLNSYRLRAKQWHPETEDVVRAMKVILTPEYQPVFVHCQAGKDRTGLVVAVYRILVDGWSVNDAIAERKAFGASDFWEENKTYLARLGKAEARRDLMAAIEAAPVPPVVTVP